MKDIFFYDTNALLTLQKEIFSKEERFYISNITLNELENIKSSGTKDEETKYNARTILRLLDLHSDKYEVIIYNQDIEKILLDKGLIKNADSQIIACAIYTLSTKIQHEKENFTFITNDLNCKAIALSVDLNCKKCKEDFDDDYTGFKVINAKDEIELSNFYINYADNKNAYNLIENQYIIIKQEDKIIDRYKWKDNRYNAITFSKPESKMFGKISPKNGDVYQQCALDSLFSNKITMLRGAAGTGKSYLALGYMFSLLEHGKIDKIVIFCNTVATKGSAKLGFYPGSRTEKLLDSQIGNLLESKLGDKIIVEKLIEEGSLILLPMSDIRGYDTTGMNAAIYISEAQNLDIELMRLALQRIGDDSICIIDGDFSHQVDMSAYAGSNNGMRRASEVFRGKSCYGEVELQNIYRSEIALIAEQM